MLSSGVLDHCNLSNKQIALTICENLNLSENSFIFLLSRIKIFDEKRKKDISHTFLMIFFSKNLNPKIFPLGKKKNRLLLKTATTQR